jgi:hypothetical protein
VYPSSRGSCYFCRCSHSKPSSSANNVSDSCTSLLFFNRVFFWLMMVSNFSISLSPTDLMADLVTMTQFLQLSTFRLYLYLRHRRIKGIASRTKIPLDLRLCLCCIAFNLNRFGFYRSQFCWSFSFSSS